MSRKVQIAKSKLPNLSVVDMCKRFDLKIDSNLSKSEWDKQGFNFKGQIKDALPRGFGRLSAGILAYEGYFLSEDGKVSKGHLRMVFQRSFELMDQEYLEDAQVQHIDRGMFDIMDS